MAANPSTLVSIINRNKNKKLAATRIIESNPNNLTIVSKLTKDSTHNGNPNDDVKNINRGMFDAIYNRLTNLRTNNEYIIKLFPDIELVIQILVSSILSPRKMTDINLNYGFKETFSIPPHISTNVLAAVETYMNDEYDLVEKLPTIVRESLFEIGAYVVVVIPEASVDNVINSDMFSNLATEAYKDKVDSIINNIVTPLNLINVSNIESSIDTNATKEELVNYMLCKENLNITDNFNILKLPVFKDKIRKNLIKRVINRKELAAESVEKLQYIDIFRTRSGERHKQLETIKTNKETLRKSIGKPLYMKIPAEAVIPIFTPGDESNHVGYFVLLDDSGRPLSTVIDTNTYNNLNNIVTGNVNTSQMTITQKAYKNLVYDNTDGLNVEELYELYSTMIEKQLYSSIKNSIYDSNIEIAGKNDIYLLMFARALADQKTSVLFIPAELVTYFAFDYNKLGIGKCLLENLSILSSLRAILLFARVMAQTKQSIDVTKVNITLDPDDPDPEKTIEEIQDGVLRLRQNYFPLRVINPMDLIEWIHRAGLQFAYEGHPGIPNVKIDFETSKIDHVVPNSDLEDDLRKQTIIALGLPPEVVDSGFSPEFATTIVNNNILLSKRVSVYQKQLLKHTNKLVQLILLNDMEIRSKLRTDLEAKVGEIGSSLTPDLKALYTKDKDEFYEQYINLLVENIEVNLPAPENTDITNLAAEYDTYKENLEKVLDSIVSTEVITEDLAGDTTMYVESIKSNFKHHLLRKWMSEKNFFHEAFDIVETDKKTLTKTMENITQHISNVMSNSTNLVSDLTGLRLAAAKDIETINNDGSGSSGSVMDSSSSEEGTDTSNEEGGDTGGEEDDFSLDL